METKKTPITIINSGFRGTLRYKLTKVFFFLQVTNHYDQDIHPCKNSHCHRSNYRTDPIAKSRTFQPNSLWKLCFRLNCTAGRMSRGRICSSRVRIPLCKSSLQCTFHDNFHEQRMNTTRNTRGHNRYIARSDRHMRCCNCTKKKDFFFNFDIFVVFFLKLYLI